MLEKAVFFFEYMKFDPRIINVEKNHLVENMITFDTVAVVSTCQTKEEAKEYSECWIESLFLIEDDDSFMKRKYAVTDYFIAFGYEETSVFVSYLIIQFNK